MSIRAIGWVSGSRGLGDLFFVSAISQDLQDMHF